MKAELTVNGDQFDITFSQDEEVVLRVALSAGELDEKKMTAIVNTINSAFDLIEAQPPSSKRARLETMRGKILSDIGDTSERDGRLKERLAAVDAELAK